tara:strand:- start:608 stop:1531 length:924 start_codon:yes stop_codon:yes gene_type:complete
MNKKTLNFLFYLSLGFFALDCGGAPTQEISQETHDSESQKYIDETLIKGAKKYSSPDIEVDNENVLITDLQSELHSSKSEIQKLRALVKGLEKQINNKIDSNLSQSIASPHSLYHQEILMESGTIYYGNIIYQDEIMVTLETMIGKLNLDRSKIVRVVSHKTDALSEIEETPVFEGLEQFPEIEDGNIIYKKPAEIILLGNIAALSDESGNTQLAGKVKNTGGRRADFVKVNITLYRDWSKSLTPKTFTVFVDGETMYLDPTDSTLVSFSSLSAKAEADFELFVPQNFGTVMSWTYEIDYEEYDYKQ